VSSRKWLESARQWPQLASFFFGAFGATQMPCIAFRHSSAMASAKRGRPSNLDRAGADPKQSKLDFSKAKPRPSQSNTIEGGTNSTIIFANAAEGGVVNVNIHVVPPQSHTDPPQRASSMVSACF
jgi:hypothetical protein